MANLESLKDILTRSVKLWEDGQPREALRFLDICLEKAKLENQPLHVQQLSLHASVIAQSLADPELVSKYSEQVLSSAPEDALAAALAFYTLADLMFRQDKPDLARQHAARSYALVAHASNEEEKGLLDLLTNKWPQVAEW